MDEFFIQNLDEISQMDKKLKIKIKMFIGLDWCRTYALGLELWKKMKNKNRNSN
jgi:hypothetical protein